VYQKNKLAEALDYYNQSVLLAPHPPPPNMFMMAGIHEQPQEDGFPHEELALGYANRSAVLFQVHQDGILFFGGGGSDPLFPFLLLIPPFFPSILYLSTILLTGMTGSSLHMHTLGPWLKIESNPTLDVLGCEVR
jgi:hypothetical protein